MAVELKMTGICENCPCAELEVNSSFFYSYNKAINRSWTIKCNNEPVCKRIIDMAEDDSLHMERRVQNE